MIDSLTAYIVEEGTSVPVEGVYPYNIVNPKQLTLQFRFHCSSEALAADAVEKIIGDTYGVEVAFNFGSFRETKTNFISITSEQLKSVESKTIVDGSGTKPQFIHRGQISTFVGKYVANLKSVIYIEDSKTDSTSLLSGLQDKFISLLEQGKHIC